MSKHILDRVRAANASARSAQYARIEVTERPHPQSKKLQRQSRSTFSTARVKRFLDIERSSQN
ncbi:hypothetical protein [Jannaschia pohangensis]|uniref:Uncharacterized protein n=1 Tax=Jannaschia pohangensis TaxID=390807 RepID=A0A1I3NZK6_9RHOB|nr:hypothetical protein [Jannaschia pohangensis]SFJ14734.1 hypothetical protein SAMN04488095_2300 [Jannaschia pohangensis]